MDIYTLLLITIVAPAAALALGTYIAIQSDREFARKYPTLASMQSRRR